MLRFLLILSAFVFVSCSKELEKDSNNPKHGENFSISEGRRLFAHYCSPCHGDNGDGLGKYLGYELNPQPPDFTSPDFLQDRSDSLLRTAVTEGSAALGKSNLCPPWGNTLRAAEIEFLVAYIKKTNEMANNDSESDQEHNEKE